MSDEETRQHLQNAIIYLRRGQLADANVSYTAYAKEHGAVPVIQHTMQRGDLLQAADLIEQILVPRHR